MKRLTLFSTLLAWVSAVILLQTLYFKFTGHPQSMEIFSKLGVEPWGRIAVGTFELIVGFMLIIPKSRFLGSFLGAVLMFGAIGSHLTTIGIESMMDGGTLFILAIIVLSFCLILCILHQNEGLRYYHKLFKK